MNAPYVSCIMPTADRHKFIPLAIYNFLNQDYRDAELVIVDDGKISVESLLPNHRRIKYFRVDSKGSIGLKRNYACEQAKGKIIMHWDDDDWYGHEWMRRSIYALDSTDADICGLNEIIFFSPLLEKFWNYSDKNSSRPWLAGATMAYRKEFWEQHQFKDLNIGEDYDYIWNTGAKIYAHDYTDGFIATLHSRNTTLKPFEDARHKKHAIGWMDVEYRGKAENPE